MRNLLNFIMVCFVLLENPIHLLRFSNGRCTGFSNKTLRKENVSKFYCHIKILNCARLLSVRRGFHRPGPPSAAGCHVTAVAAGPDVGLSEN